MRNERAPDYIISPTKQKRKSRTDRHVSREQPKSKHPHHVVAQRCAITTRPKIGQGGSSVFIHGTLHSIVLAYVESDVTSKGQLAV